jgi:hypothetical protein
MSEQEQAGQDGVGAELTAMAQVDQILRPLDPVVTGRVVRWIAERYKIRVEGQGLTATPIGSPTAAPASTADLAELFSAASPVTQDQKALVAGYWFQVVKGASDLDAQAVNTELKQLGHGMKNITAAFGELISSRPQLVIQVRKSGNTRQARKKYRLTSAGLDAVRAMLRQEVSS